MKVVSTFFLIASSMAFLAAGGAPPMCCDIDSHCYVDEQCDCGNPNTDTCVDDYARKKRVLARKLKSPKKSGTCSEGGVCIEKGAQVQQEAEKGAPKSNKKQKSSGGRKLLSPRRNE
jgi:hypothetical protein